MRASPCPQSSLSARFADAEMAATRDRDARPRRRGGKSPTLRLVALPGEYERAKLPRWSSRNEVETTPIEAAILTLAESRRRGR